MSSMVRRCCGLDYSEAAHGSPRRARPCTPQRSLAHRQALHPLKPCTQSGLTHYETAPCTWPPPAAPPPHRNPNTGPRRKATRGSSSPPMPQRLPHATTALACVTTGHALCLHTCLPTTAPPPVCHVCVSCLNVVCVSCLYVRGFACMSCVFTSLALEQVRTLFSCTDVLVHVRTLYTCSESV